MPQRTFDLFVPNQQDRLLYENHSTFHDGDAGLDLFVTKDVTIPPKTTVLIDLGVHCQSRSTFLFKERYHSYLLMPRSSISKSPLVMQNSVGLIDKGYTGSVKAPMYNTSDNEFAVKRGERYVQLVNGDLSDIHFRLVDKLRDTSRGQQGFGSTGQ